MYKNVGNDFSPKILSHREIFEADVGTVISGGRVEEKTCLCIILTGQMRLGWVWQRKVFKCAVETSSESCNSFAKVPCNWFLAAIYSTNVECMSCIWLPGVREGREGRHTQERWWRSSTIYWWKYFYIFLMRLWFCRCQHRDQWSVRWGLSGHSGRGKQQN